MTFGLLITSGSQVIDFEDRGALTMAHPYRFRVVDDAGLGMAPLHRLSERGPLQHGDSDEGMRLDPRVFSLTILVEALDVASYWLARAAVLRIFKPNTTSALSLAYTLDSGVERTIEAVTIKGLEFPMKTRMYNKHKETVQLKASDPTFYDPNTVTVPFSVGGSGSGFTVPMPVPIGVGSPTVNQTTSVIYEGDWLEYPIITIVGPITNPVVTHLGTGDVLDFTGTALIAGESLIIDTRYGRKTVVDEVGNNMLSALSDSSSIATFALLPDPDLANGINDIKVTGTLANSLTGVYLAYNNRYTGI